ncbi:hypothetical protein MAR_005310 [Mya arenaria]|uniref:Uncharacterized protein n=1 Tax=Mya arenaria TaxID=6604 RepID=A0ABY7F0S4_MYAAR|nr:uncharacterized protein LOC128246883 [Mya arenaria]WAR15205.1 hypothetical protein MAR_005310 [Mya arenaria]
MDRYGKGSTLPLYGTGSSSGQTGPSKPSIVSNLGLSQHLQISGYMVLASCLFWVFMIYFGFRGAQYGLLYMSLDDADLDEIGCCANFGGTLQDNRNFIEKYPKGDTVPYLMRLGPETFSGGFKGTEAPGVLQDIPPIVTAVASADFYHVQSLIRQWKEEIKPHIPEAKFIIYDIGLFESEINLIAQHCNCDVRTFRPDSYPNHVADISNFAYRPIIIQTIIEEYGSVLWLNPNMLITRHSDLNQLKYRGERDFFLWPSPHVVNTVGFTNPRMFTFLTESRCCYTESEMVDISTMAFYRTNTLWMDIMKPWLTCALNAECIAPPKSTYSACFETRAPKTTGCHRFDQSILSILMERMFQFTSKSEKYVVPRLSRAQDEYLEYFPEQPWTYTEMFFVSAVPLTCVGGLIYMFVRRRQVVKSRFRKR